MAKFAELRAEANKNRKPTPPYVLEDVSPPVEITAPTDLERTIGLSEVVSPTGEFAYKDSRRILELFCGDAFGRVWDLLRKEHTRVMVALVNDILDHFKEDLNDVNSAGDVPGGSAASSNS
jgi:hypothetical protein